MSKGKATKASNSIKTNYTKDPSTSTHKLTITGRATSVLGKLQGDHVTAYALVEKGLHRAISGVTDAEVGELYELANRDSLRHRRGKLYEFVSSIAVLDQKNIDKLYNGIHSILEDYNESRESKTELREETKRLQNDESLIGKNLSSALKSVEASYNKNGKLLRDTLTEICRLILTFYNHIPRTSYLPIKGFEAASNEGSTIRNSLTAIDKELVDYMKYDDSSIASRTAKNNHLNKIIKSIANLMHYPEITNDKILTKHQSDAIASTVKLIEPRDNRKSNLIKALARHLHIVSTAYPELKEELIRDSSIKDFVTLMIRGKDKELWPKYSKNKSIKEISESVKVELEEIQEQLGENRYINNDYYIVLESSSDEDEPTKPRKKGDNTDLLRELDELRKYKQIMEEAIKKGDIELPPSTKVKLAKACPHITKQSKLSLANISGKF